jgi:hypothetical protein
MITLGMLLMRAALWWQRMFTSEYAKTSELYTFSSHSLKIDMLWSLIYSREVTLLICFDVADTMLGWLVRENDQQRGDNKNLAILQSPSVVFISCSSCSWEGLCITVSLSINKITQQVFY